MRDKQYTQNVPGSARSILVAWDEEAKNHKRNGSHQPSLYYHRCIALLQQIGEQRHPLLWSAMLDHSLEGAKDKATLLATEDIFFFAQRRFKALNRPSDAPALSDRAALRISHEARDTEIIVAIGSLYAIAQSLTGEVAAPSVLFQQKLSAQDASRDATISLLSKALHLNMALEPYRAAMPYSKEEQNRLKASYREADAMMFHPAINETLKTPLRAYIMLMRLLTSQMYMVLASFSSKKNLTLQFDVVDVIHEYCQHMSHEAKMAGLTEALFQDTQLHRLGGPVLHAACMISYLRLAHSVWHGRIERCDETLKWFHKIREDNALSVEYVMRAEPITYWHCPAGIAEYWQSYAPYLLRGYEMSRTVFPNKSCVPAAALASPPRGPHEEEDGLISLTKAAIHLGHEGKIDPTTLHIIFDKRESLNPGHAQRYGDIRHLLSYFFYANAACASEGRAARSQLGRAYDVDYFYSIYQKGFEVLWSHYHVALQQQLAQTSHAPSAVVGAKRSLELEPTLPCEPPHPAIRSLSLPTISASSDIVDQPALPPVSRHAIYALSRKRLGISGEALVPIMGSLGARCGTPQELSQIGVPRLLKRPPLYPPLTGHKIVLFYQMLLFKKALEDCLVEQCGLPYGTEGYVEQRLTEILQLRWQDRQSIQEGFELLTMPSDEQASLEACLEQHPTSINPDVGNKVDQLMNHILCRFLEFPPPGQHIPEKAHPVRGPSEHSK